MFTSIYVCMCVCIIYWRGWDKKNAPPQYTSICIGIRIWRNSHISFSLVDDRIEGERVVAANDDVQCTILLAQARVRTSTTTPPPRRTNGNRQSRVGAPFNKHRSIGIFLKIIFFSLSYFSARILFVFFSVQDIGFTPVVTFNCSRKTEKNIRSNNAFWSWANCLIDAEAFNDINI